MMTNNRPVFPSKTGNALKFLRVNSDEDGFEYAAAGGSFAGYMDDIPDGDTYVKTENNLTDAEKTKLANLSGVNTGDQDLSGKANVVHSHAISDVTGLQTALDGKQAIGTGVLIDRQFSLLQSDGTLNAASGVQTWAGTNKTGQDVFTVAANTTYLVEGYWYVNTGNTTHTTAIAWALNTATVTNFQYQVILWSSAANAVVTAQSTVHVSGVASKVLNATSAAVWTLIQFSGIMVVGTGGTITPQINFSANPTGTNLMKRGSWTSFTRLGTDAVTSAGGWS